MAALTCQAFRDGDRWVAECLELGVVVHAQDLPGTRARLHTAIEDLLNECLELRRQGERPEIVPVHNYWLKSLLWHWRMWRQERRRGLSIPRRQFLHCLAGRHLDEFSTPSSSSRLVSHTHEELHKLLRKFKELYLS